MTREAERVYVDPAAIARLESLVPALPNGAHVALQLADGSEVRGIVAARPILQLFFDPAGTEGSNAVLRLDVPPGEHAPQGVRDVWLGDIVAIRALGPP